jgi:hypothetical protein
MSIGRDGVGLCVLGDKLMAVGGYDGTQYLDLVEAFDPISNTWAQVSANLHIISEPLIFLKYVNYTSNKNKCQNFAFCRKYLIFGRASLKSGSFLFPAGAIEPKEGKHLHYCDLISQKRLDMYIPFLTVISIFTLLLF